MCPFTNENYYGLEGGAALNLIDQVRDTLKRNRDDPPYELLALYNDGNFFAPKEIPLSVQLEIAELVEASGVGELVVECLPQFIKPDVIGPFVERLGRVQLEVGIGLQSANAFVREVCVNTSFTNKSFEDAVETLLAVGATPKIYLMIKPPFLSEEEGVVDVLNSLDYLSEMHLDSITLCPTRVSKNTLAATMYNAGLYTPPNLWSIVDILQSSKSDRRLRVACINLRGTDFESIFPESCDKCADLIVESLEKFSLSSQQSDLPTDCSCRPTTKDLHGKKLDIRKIESRVAATLPFLEAGGHTLPLR